MGLIPLWRGGVVAAHAVVDDSDHAGVARHKWWINADGRAIKWSSLESLHRFILAPPPGIEVDHINRDPLDNRRSNLRLVTHAQNVQNKPSYQGSASRFRGVSWHKGSQRWHARARLNGKLHYLGAFTSEEEAGACAAAWRKDNMPFSEEALCLAHT